VAVDPSIAAIASIAVVASIAASVSCEVLLVLDGAAPFAVAVDLAVGFVADFVADFFVALDVTAGWGDGWGDGTSSLEAPSSTHLSAGQKPEAQLALHHCVSPESPVMLVHDWGSAVVGAGEGCSGMGTFARPRGAAAPQHPIAVASMPRCKGTRIAKRSRRAPSRTIPPPQIR